MKNVMKVKIEYFYLALLFVLLYSRILVLTNNYNWPINPISLEEIYIVLSSLLVVVVKRGFVIRKRIPEYIILLGLLCHCILWGKVFVNDSIIPLINSLFESQLIYLIIIIITVICIQLFNLEYEFFICSFAVVSLALFAHLISNLGDVNWSSLIYAFDYTKRERVNFGLGHYNLLGAICLSNIYLGDNVRLTKHKWVKIFIYMFTYFMLLCSASRSAMLGLAIYYMCRINFSTAIISANKKWKAILYCTEFCVAVCVLVWYFLYGDVGYLLQVSQRSHIVDAVLPTFRNSGKILFGCGLASNVSYASGLTPYTTYWLDNSYVYYLFTTGIIGILFILFSTILMLVALFRRRKTFGGARGLAVYIAYLFICMFEANLFNSGGVINYFIIVALLLNVSSKEKRILGNYLGEFI